MSSRDGTSVCPKKADRTSRNIHLRKTYGISLKEAEELLSKQGNKCLICKRVISLEVPMHSTERAVIDHEHDSSTSNKVIRGILCRNCNLGLGSFSDSIDTLRRAIVYLKLYHLKKEPQNESNSR